MLNSTQLLVAAPCPLSVKERSRHARGTRTACAPETIRTSDLCLRSFTHTPTEQYKARCRLVGFRLLRVYARLRRLTSSGPSHSFTCRLYGFLNRMAKDFVPVGSMIRYKGRAAASAISRRSFPGRYFSTDACVSFAMASKEVIRRASRHMSFGVGWPMSASDWQEAWRLRLALVKRAHLPRSPRARLTLHDWSKNPAHDH
jgi:hypothetical protein